MYFVTLCVKDREHLLGEIVRNEIELSKAGGIVKECWQVIPDHFPNAELDEFVIMPDHMHGIVIVSDPGSNNFGVGTRHAVSRQVVITPRSGEQFGRPIRGSLTTIIRSFKSAASNRIHKEGYLTFSWQSRFYDRIVRDQHELGRIREYIRSNPERWSGNEKQ